MSHKMLIQCIVKVSVLGIDMYKGTLIHIYGIRLLSPSDNII